MYLEIQIHARDEPGTSGRAREACISRSAGSWHVISTNSSVDEHISGGPLLGGKKVKKKGGGGKRVQASAGMSDPRC